MERNKAGRPRADNPMVHTAITLPKELLDALRYDAKENGRGLSSEIRTRLYASYGVRIETIGKLPSR
jgi:hypothetical protein